MSARTLRSSVASGPARSPAAGQRLLGRVEVPLGRPTQAFSEVAALSLRCRREAAARGVDGRHTHPQLALHLRVGERHRERPCHVLEQPRHLEQRPIVDHDGELLPVAPDRRHDPVRIGLTDGDLAALLVDIAAPWLERIGDQQGRIAERAPEPRAQALVPVDPNSMTSPATAAADQSPKRRSAAKPAAVAISASS